MRIHSTAMIHPTAIIDDSARLDENVHIGPYCIVGENVAIGAGTILNSHVVIGKNTTIGQNNHIYQFASIGEVPQDKKFAGEESYLQIGDYNQIREACSFHRGTSDGGLCTKIGNHNLFMVNTHVAHDCVIGDHNIFANNVGISGHVIVGDYVIIGGNSGIRQFCRVDSYSMVAAASLVLKDVAAFVTVGGNPASAKGLNKEGMRRKGWNKQTIELLNEAYRLVFRSAMITDEALVALEGLIVKEPKVALLYQSLKSSTRGLVR